MGINNATHGDHCFRVASGLGTGRPNIALEAFAIQDTTCPMIEETQKPSYMQSRATGSSDKVGICHTGTERLQKVRKSQNTLEKVRMHQKRLEFCHSDTQQINV